MDPNETLHRIRELAAALTGPRLLTNTERAQLGAELAGHLEALDTWLTHAGALPQAWIRPGGPHTGTGQ